MFLINRDSVVIKGKQPLVDYINSHNPEAPISLADVHEDCTVILLPECQDRENAVSIIESNYEVIFFGEIEGWQTDESLWPTDVTLEKFRDWFQVEYHDMVFDALEEEIEKRKDEAGE